MLNKHFLLYFVLLHILFIFFIINTLYLVSRAHKYTVGLRLGNISHKWACYCTILKII